MNLILALLLGPFYFFKLSFKEGLIALLIPAALFAALVFALFDGNWGEALTYRNEFAIWTGVYWLLCMVTSLIAVYEQKEKRKKAPFEVQANDSIKQWLQQNPGKTLNDYFSKFPV